MYTTDDVLLKLVDIEDFLTSSDIDQLYNELVLTNEYLEQICFGIEFIMTLLTFIIFVVVIRYVYKLFNFLLRG